MTGILSALRGYLRDAAPGGVLNPEVTPQGILDAAAVSSMVVPGVGDVAGLLADVNRYRTDPGSRTAGNFALTGIGMLPLIPSLTVWHGSPHRFKPTAKNPLGEFDPTRIGTGEGAQVKGYGHYVAESKRVPRSPETNYMQNERILKRVSGGLTPLQERISDAMDAGKTAEQAFSELTGIGYKVPSGKFPTPFDAFRAEWDVVKGFDSGFLYKADLADEAIPKMLDWDKPLSQQPEVVKALKRIVPGDVSAEARTKILDGMYGSTGMTGRELYRLLANQRGLNETSAEKWASDYLKSLGISGNVYLDAGSRGAGQGTRNFVVFPGNEGILKILGVE